MQTPAPASPPRDSVTLIHDYLLVMRGAERTFAAIAELYADAPILTLLYDEEATQQRFRGRVTASTLQRLGVSQRTFRRLLPLYPLAVERLQLPPSDVVLSSSSAFAHGVRVPPGAVHVCYCHAPFRYAWYEEARALGELPAALRPLLRMELRRVRAWDARAASRVDSYIANSALTRERIKRYYGRDSVVIHPPVETGRFAPGSPGDSLLVVSELVRHKRVHVALEAARRARAPISVVGTGPEQEALSAAYPDARFLGRAGDDELAQLYSRARAVVVPSIEEFGITAVEAQAAGRPVIAAAAGGALETVLDGSTGLLALPDDAGSFAQAIAAIDKLAFDPGEAVANAERFSVERFKARIATHVARVLDARRRPSAEAAPETSVPVKQRGGRGSRRSRPRAG
jgi:glycosyltransferase involved in cell wall biosynthesis